MDSFFSGVIDNMLTYYNYFTLAVEIAHQLEEGLPIPLDPLDLLFQEGDIDPMDMNNNDEFFVDRNILVDVNNNGPVDI
ncbi:hypothetical protein QR680_008068 [Steinernema hermaphroditum]|uniref:Uncharacterized protein n=1 Tax=Steinernema hermaphroditum TaxID=289476 RepID=A0AA39IHP4_9BILA|nr:hypothetical protein QR680_008068 [Steinernema hermaphroditum]